MRVKPPCAGPRVDQALAEPQFRELWRADADKGFKAYAMAALSFAGSDVLDQTALRSLALEIATSKRAMLLDRLSRRQGWANRMRLLPKTDWSHFTASDWLNLFDSTSSDKRRRALGHLQTISPTLVGQLNHVPEKFLHPSIVAALSELAVSPEHWSRLASAVTAMPRAYLDRIRHRISAVGSIGDFWDIYFECVSEPWKAFDLPEALLGSPLLKPLLAGAELGREGRTMRNCLAQRVQAVRKGREAYFRWMGQRPAIVQLVHRNTWRLGRILGYRNAPVEPEELAHIRMWVDLMLARLAEQPQANPSDQAIAELANRTASRPNMGTDRSAIISTLESIRGQSTGMGPGGNAYCIFETDAGFVQFLADVDGKEFLCEIQSHKFHRPIERLLTDKTVSLLENCGFSWPSEAQNFARWLQVEPGVDSVANFCLGILTEMLGHQPGVRLSIISHFPRLQCSPTPPIQTRH